MTNKELLNLFEALGRLTDLVGDPQLIYSLVLLRKQLEAPAEALRSAIAPPPRVQEYERRRHALCRQFSDKDLDGQPCVDKRGHYLIGGSRKPEFVSSMQALVAEFQTNIDSYNSQSTEREQLWERTADYSLPLPRIPLAAFQGNVSVLQVEALFPILTPTEYSAAS